MVSGRIRQLVVDSEDQFWSTEGLLLRADEAAAVQELAIDYH